MHSFQQKVTKRNVVPGNKIDVTTIKAKPTPHWDSNVRELPSSKFNFSNLPLQAKMIAVSQSGDPSEQEADRIADKVMKMPYQISDPFGNINTENKAVVAEEKEKGGGKKIDQKCHSCEKKEKEQEQEEKTNEILENPNLIRRKTLSSNYGLLEDKKTAQDSKTAPGGIGNIHSSSSGSSLDTDTRKFMESRFDNYDFSNIKIHSDETAARNASALSAEAFTIGNHIYFSQGKYSPSSAKGRELIAHELVHTIQQQGATEQSSLHSFTIQRKVVVNDPLGKPSRAPSGTTTTNEAIIKDYVSILCPIFTVNKVGTESQVMPINSNSCSLVDHMAFQESCRCLCQMHNLKESKGNAKGSDITWIIEVNDDVYPVTDPRTKTVFVHSPFSGMQFGAWTAGKTAHRGDMPNWLVLGHELCGHAVGLSSGIPQKEPDYHGGRPGAESTINIQNKIAEEHGIPSSELRGLSRDPHHGESLAKVSVDKFPLNSDNVASLPASENEKLQIAAKFIEISFDKPNPAVVPRPVMMDIIGHADHTGPESNNVPLSTLRAQNVKSELIKLLPSDIKSKARFLVTKGVSSSECTLFGDQPGCRKVDIFMYTHEGGSQSHK